MESFKLKIRFKSDTLTHPLPEDRTYHFQAESELDRKRWTTVIRNNIDQSIRAETGPNDQDSGISSDERKLREVCYLLARHDSLT